MAIINVSNASQLQAALKSANAGDEIVLADGNYGAVEIKNVSFSDYVTIRAANDLGAVFTQIEINGSDHIAIDGVHVSNPGNGAASTKLVSIDDGSHDVQFVNSEVNGKVDDVYTGWFGLYSGDAKNVLFENNYVHDVKNGVAMFGTDDVSLIGNEFDYLGNDSIKAAGVNGILIENNVGSRHVFPETGHLDFIQFQGSSSNIVIRGNVLLTEERANIQGIFLDDATYTNVLIEDNILYTGMANGIYLSNGSNVKVYNNTLLNVPGEVHPQTIIRVPSGSDVQNNIIGTESKGGMSGTNMYIQYSNPNADYYYGDFFKNATVGLGATIDDLEVVSGSLADISSGGMGAAERLAELLGQITDTDDDDDSDVGYDNGDGATDDGATGDGSTDDGSTDDGSTDDGSGDGGSTDNGSNDGGSTDDGSTDDGSVVDDGAGTDIDPNLTPLLLAAFDGASAAVVSSDMSMENGAMVAQGPEKSGSVLLAPVSLDGFDDAEIRIDLKTPLDGAQFDGPGSSMSDYIIIEASLDGGAFQEIDYFYYSRSDGAFISDTSSFQITDDMTTLVYDVDDGVSEVQLRITAVATDPKGAERIEIHEAGVYGVASDDGGSDPVVDDGSNDGDTQNPDDQGSGDQGSDDDQDSGGLNGGDSADDGQDTGGEGFGAIFSETFDGTTDGVESGPFKASGGAMVVAGPSHSGRMLMKPVSLDGVEDAEVRIMVSAQDLGGIMDGPGSSLADYFIIEMSLDGGDFETVDYYYYNRSAGVFQSDTNSVKVGSNAAMLTYAIADDVSEVQVRILGVTSDPNQKELILFHEVSVYGEQVETPAGDTSEDTSDDVATPPADDDDDDASMVYSQVFHESFDDASDAIESSPMTIEDGAAVSAGPDSSGAMVLKPISLDGVENAELKIEVNAPVEGAQFDIPESTMADYFIVEVSLDGGEYEELDFFYWNREQKAFVSDSSSYQIASDISTLTYAIEDGASEAQIRISSITTDPQGAERIQIQDVAIYGDTPEPAESSADALLATLAAVDDADDLGATASATTDADLDSLLAMDDDDSSVQHLHDDMATT